MDELKNLLEGKAPESYVEVDPALVLALIEAKEEPCQVCLDLAQGLRNYIAEYGLKNESRPIQKVGDLQKVIDGVDG